jgi:hypothetical protein
MRIVCCCILLLAFSTAALAEGARYLIITDDTYYDEILPLAEWKTKKGILTEVRTTSQTGSSPSQIRSYVQNAYNTWNPRPEYLLLVGDYNDIDMPSDDGAYTDNYYTDITGNDLNEIIPGRFCVSTTSDAEVAVAKSMNYERYPYLGNTGWYRKGCRVGRDGESSDPIYWSALDYAADMMYAAGYTYVDSFSSEPPSNNTATDVIAAIDNGRSIVCYRGQGTCDWWGPFDDVPQNTNNGWMLPFVISPTCAQIYSYGTDCGDLWLKLGTVSTPKAGIGFCGTTYIGSGSTLARKRSAMLIGTIDGIFDPSTNARMGDAVEWGRQALLDSFPGDYLHYNSFVLLGDPELPIFTAVPLPMTVVHGNSLPLATSSFYVTVNYVGGPIPDALVCLYKDGDVYMTDSTNASGQASFTVSPSSIGTMYVTVTKHNFIPYEGSATVEDTTPPVADFSGSPTSGGQPLTVNFSDLSSGYTDTWVWSFGDGDSAFVENPSHTYWESGWFDVSLYVSGPYGNDVELKTGYIHVTEPPDSAWLSTDASGDTILNEHSVDLDYDVTYHFILSNNYDTAHAIMYPVCYDTAYFELLDLSIDSSAFPLSEYFVWNFFEEDTIENDSGKVMFYAWTANYSAGVPFGRTHIGTATFDPKVTGQFTVDTCFYPPQGHLYYTDGRSGDDYWPIWYPVDVTIISSLCGDVNDDGSVTTGDGFQILNYFGSGPAPVTCWSANVNGDGSLTTGDGFHLLNYFGSGPTLNCAPCVLTVEDPKIQEE